MAVLIALESHIKGLVVHFNIVGENASLLAERILKIIVVKLIHERQVGRASPSGSSYPKYATLLCPLVIYPILDVKDVDHVRELVARLGSAVSSRVKSATSVEYVPMCEYSRPLYIYQSRVSASHIIVIKLI